MPNRSRRWGCSVRLQSGADLNLPRSGQPQPIEPSSETSDPLWASGGIGAPIDSAPKRPARR